MADSIWISTDGNLNAAGSWSPSGVPGAAGNIAFNSSSHVDVLSGLTALSLVDLERVWTAPDYEGNIGAPGNPLETAIKRFIIQGAGSVWYNQQSHATGGYTVVDSPNQQDAFVLTSTSQPTGNFYFLNGGVAILDGAGATGSMFVASRNLYQLPNVSIGTGVTVINYSQRTGVVTTKSVLGSSRCVIDGGLLIYDSSATAAWTTTIHVAGGTLEYNSTGTPDHIAVLSGTLDMTKDSRAKTINALTLMPGSNFMTHNNITVTNLFDLRGTVPVLP